jgi:putative flippase GtrA
MLKKLLFSKTQHMNIQLFRALIAGGVACTGDFIALYILTNIFNVYYLISAIIAFCIGTIISYFASIIWVFDKRKLDNKKFEFILFCLIGIVGLGINEMFIWFFTEKVLLFYMYSKIIATIAVYFTNFFSRRMILF